MNSNNLFFEGLRARQPLAFRIFTQALLKQQLAHAYLLAGRNRNDQWQIARHIACFLNCRAKKSYLDFQGICYLATESDSKKILCQNCSWICNDEHPQAWLKLGQTGNKSGKISVEDARMLSAELSKTSQFYRVIVIEEAGQDVFHRPAANALLKTMEEPAANCIFFLFSNNVDEVIPTVVSRCQVIPIRSCLPTLDGIEIPQPSSTELLDVTYALEYSRSLHAFIDQNSDSVQESMAILDSVVKAEVEYWQDISLSNKLASDYLRLLLILTEEVKGQIGHYVSNKTAITSFILSWNRLRNKLGKNLAVS